MVDFFWYFFVIFLVSYCVISKENLSELNGQIHLWYLEYPSSTNTYIIPFWGEYFQ